MANMVGHQADNSNEVNRKKQIWLRVMMVLAAIVVFFTTYALILPAITMEGNLVCELEEHTHTSDCYETVYVEDSRALGCSENHEHTDSCYEIAGHYEEQLICGMAEHTHTSECYDAHAADAEKYSCGMAEHTHSDSCYDASGSLTCTIPEHTHSKACTGRRMLAAPLLAAANGDETIYWKPITTTSELTKNGVYIIATADSDIALSGSSAQTNVEAGMIPNDDKPGYYTTNLGENYWWTVSSNGSGKLENVGTGYNVALDTSNILSSNNSTSNTYQYNQSGTSLPGWDISTSVTTTRWIGLIPTRSTTTYHLVYNGSKFAYNTSSYLPMTIYKMETSDEGGGDTPVTPGGGGSGDEGATKPEYPSYIDVSGGKHGNTASGGVAGEYWSDPSTSQLESWFKGVSKDNGKVLTDKSVIYGHDDYNAFDSYAPNTFGVTLSTLAQSYALTDELDVKVPLDVVFVLDTSGSMVDTKIGSTNSANVMVEALNDIMQVIMDQNEDNRVGVVSFSGSGHELLPLGHYTEPNGQFFQEGIYNPTNLNKDTLTLQPNSTIQRTDGELKKGSFTGWWGTYTQHGIATGAQEFLDVTDTTVSGVVTKEIDGQEISASYTVTRRPIIILVSDGDPTYCTHEYNNVLNAGSVYGDGNSGYNNNNQHIDKSTNNNKGIMGYYTILSAQHYKNAIAKHYNTDAYFYSIGIGMYESGSDSYSLSVSGDDYKRAVLNPTRANISPLASCTNNKTDSLTTNQRYISDYSDVTCHQLYQLLHNQYSNNTVTVGYYNDNGASERKYGVAGKTSNTAKVINNPYYSTGYNYADGAFFTTQASVEALRTAFADALNFTNDLTVYGFILRNNEPVIVSDTIGDGMELKSDPILRYGGQNYSPVGEPEVKGNVKIYHYGDPEQPYVDEFSHREVDVSKITAEVETVNGVQTVRLMVHDSELPVYLPELDVDGNPLFYYEELPARLIYQVGLTDEAKQDIAALKETGGESLTYYTNAWENGEYANSNFQPTTKNPYYKDNTYDKDTLDKHENTTSTEKYAWLYDTECDANHVSEHLGNNGKLVFDANKDVLVDVNLLKVDESGNPITTDTAKFQVYADAELTELKGTYETDENGKLTIRDLIADKTYYLKEIEAPDGFALVSEAKAISVDENGNLSIEGSDFYLSADGSTLKFKNTEPTSLSVLKKWVGDVGPSVEVELLANGEPTGRYANLNSDNNWYHMWDDLPKYAADGSEIKYSVREFEVDNYSGEIHLWTGPGDPYGQTGGEGWVQKTAFENGKTYLIRFGSYILGYNSSENKAWGFTYDESNIPNYEKWDVTVGRDGKATLTNEYNKKTLAVNYANGTSSLYVGNGNLATSWQYDSTNNLLYATYYTTTFYYMDGGNGVTTNKSNATKVYLYTYESTVVEDSVEKGATHYIIKNTKQETGNIELTLTKVNSETGNLVNGAKFELYRETGEINNAVVIPETDNRYGVLVNEWTSDGNGKVLSGLQYGTYYLIETEAPYGYEPLEEPIVFTVGAVDGVRKATIVQHPTMNGTFTEMDIPNIPIPSYMLPETGGMGTLPIYALGALLVIGALVYGSFLRRKREGRAG